MGYLGNGQHVEDCTEVGQVDAGQHMYSRVLGLVDTGHDEIVGQLDLLE